MPGMPQGRDINEAGAKIRDSGHGRRRSIARIEERVTSIAQFEEVSLDATRIDDWRDLVGALGRVIERARDGVASEHLVVRLHLTGTTPLAWRIRRDRDLLKSEVDDRTSMIGASWVEKLEVDCKAPGAAAASRDDPITELRRLIDEEVIRSDAYQAEAVDIAEELRAQLPQECRNLLGADEAAFKAAIAELVKEGVEDVLARLHAGAEAREP